MNRPTSGLLACLLMLNAAPAGAQSLLSSTGLGMPLPPLDARARALGGLGAGLSGPGLLATDPAAAADLDIPSLAFTFQTSWVDVTEVEGVGTFSATRFPTIAVSYPVSGLGTVSVGFGSVFDQRWTIERQRTLVLDGTGTEARVTDSFLSEGGLSAIRLGLARRLSPSLAVGLQVGRHMGDVTRRFTRSFDSLDVETGVGSYQIGGLWNYSGLTATLGASAELGGIVHVSGSYTVSGDLDARASADTEAPGRSYRMPSEVRAGATAVLAPGLSIAAGLYWADWQATGDDLTDASGRRTLSLGGGLEWADARLLGKTSALRLGYRRDELPFGTTDAPEPLETAFTGGLGMNLLESGGQTLATLDLALEKGRRDAGPLEERFWRLVTSVRISGF